MEGEDRRNCSKRRPVPTSPQAGLADEDEPVWLGNPLNVGAKSRSSVNKLLALDPRERPAFLAAACGDDDALRDDVQSLLVHTSRAADFLDSSALAAMAHAVADPQPVLVAGRRIGTTKSADPSAPAEWARSIERATRGWTATSRSSSCRRTGRRADGCARFEREARTIALLNHPDIGAIYDVERRGRRPLPGDGADRGRDARRG